MIIRPAQPTDSLAAAYLLNHALKDIAEALTGETEHKRILEILASFFEQEPNRLSYKNCLVSEIDDRVVGIIVLYHGSEAKDLDQPILTYLQEKKNDPILTLDVEADLNDYYIDTLCVHPEFSGKGIGTALIHKAEEQAKQMHYDRISLNVEEENHGAFRLYDRLGYHSIRNITIHHKTYHYMVKQV